MYNISLSGGIWKFFYKIQILKATKLEKKQIISKQRIKSYISDTALYMPASNLKKNYTTTIKM